MLRILILCLMVAATVVSAVRVTTHCSGDPHCFSIKKGYEDCFINNGPYLCFTNPFMRVHCSMSLSPGASPGGPTYLSNIEVWYNNGVEMHSISSTSGPQFENGATQIFDTNGNLWLEVVDNTGGSTAYTDFVVIDHATATTFNINGWPMGAGIPSIYNIFLDADEKSYECAEGLLVSGCLANGLSTNGGGGVKVGRRKRGGGSSDCSQVSGSKSATFTTEMAQKNCEFDSQFIKDAVKFTMNTVNSMNRFLDITKKYFNEEKA